MRAGAIVRGRIVDESGKGVGAARVEFNAPGEQGTLDVPIEKDGTFRWDTAPCGALTFRARARDGGESEAVGLTLTPGAEAESC